jgi:hypothetical protein
MNLSKFKFIGDNVRLQIFLSRLVEMEADLGVEGMISISAIQNFSFF